MTNRIPRGFLADHRKGRPGEVRWIPLARGCLRLEYGTQYEAEQLGRVSFVLEKTRDAPAVGRRLVLMLHADGIREKAVFIAENALSGLQWAAGCVSGGTTLDIDPGDDGSDTRHISLDDWVDECLRIMIEEGSAKRGCG